MESYSDAFADMLQSTELPDDFIETFKQNMIDIKQRIKQDRTEEEIIIADKAIDDFANTVLNRLSAKTETTQH